MSWQKCPICEGTGKVINYLMGEEHVHCPTCQGHRIIDTKTGLPPGVVDLATGIWDKDITWDDENFEDQWFSPEQMREIEKFFERKKGDADE